MKKIKLNEQDILSIVTKCTKKVLKESLKRDWGGTYQSSWAGHYNHIEEIKRIVTDLNELLGQMLDEKGSLPSALTTERDNMEQEIGFIRTALDSLKQYYKYHVEWLNNSVDDGVKWYGQKQPDWYPLKENISLADYDNPDVRYNRMDGDEMSMLDQYDLGNDGPTNEPDSQQGKLNSILRLRDQGVFSDVDVDAIRERLGL